PPAAFAFFPTGRSSDLPALKVKLPPPPLVCLDTVRLATAWLVKAQLVLTRTIAVTLVPPPFCNGPSGGGGGGSAQPPLELKPALDRKSTRLNSSHEWIS